MTRALITGLGVVCSLGSGTGAFWRGLARPPAPPADVPDEDARFAVRHYHLAAGGDVPAEPAHLGDAVLGQASRMAVAAAGQAVADAGWRTPPEPGRVAVLFGTAMGDYPLRERLSGGSAEWFTEYLVASAVAEAVGCEGAVTTVANACAASGYALGIAADMIRCGEADAVVVGGADSYSRVAMANFNRMGAVDPVRCRPFDRDRQGTVFGEGAAVLILESAEHAARRGAGPAYAEVAGTGWSCDAHHLTAPEPGGAQMVRAMRRSFADAGVDADAVACVIPHGTGTRLNDQVECEALAEVFGARSAQVPLFNLKALIGHTAGAAGAMAAVAAALMLREQSVPPNLGRGVPDPECEVRLDPQPVPLAAGHVLANAYAFGGNNVSLLLGKVAA